jgi:hypothetical protein
VLGLTVGHPGAHRLPAPVTISWPWPAATATVTDVFGRARTIQRRDGLIELPVSVTPVFVTEPPGAATA